MALPMAQPGNPTPQEQAQRILNALGVRPRDVFAVPPGMGQDVGAGQTDEELRDPAVAEQYIYQQLRAQGYDDAIARRMAHDQAYGGGAAIGGSFTPTYPGGSPQDQRWRELQGQGYSAQQAAQIVQDEENRARAPAQTAGAPSAAPAPATATGLPPLAEGTPVDQPQRPIRTDAQIAEAWQRGEQLPADEQRRLQQMPLMSRPGPGGKLELSQGVGPGGSPILIEPDKTSGVTTHLDPKTGHVWYIPNEPGKPVQDGGILPGFTPDPKQTTQVSNGIAYTLNDDGSIRSTRILPHIVKTEDGSEVLLDPDNPDPNQRNRVLSPGRTVGNYQKLDFTAGVAYGLDKDGNWVRAPELDPPKQPKPMEPVKDASGATYLWDPNNPTAAPTQLFPGKANTRPIQDAQGNWLILNEDTGKTTPIEGLAKPDRKAPLEINGKFYDRDKYNATGEFQEIEGLKAPRKPPIEINGKYYDREYYDQTGKFKPVEGLPQTHGRPIEFQGRLFDPVAYEQTGQLVEIPGQPAPKPQRPEPMPGGGIWIPGGQKTRILRYNEATTQAPYTVDEYNGTTYMGRVAQGSPQQIGPYVDENTFVTPGAERGYYLGLQAGYQPPGQEPGGQYQQDQQPGPEEGWYSGMGYGNNAYGDYGWGQDVGSGQDESWWDALRRTAEEHNPFSDAQNNPSFDRRWTSEYEESPRLFGWNPQDIAEGWTGHMPGSTVRGLLSNPQRIAGWAAEQASRVNGGVVGPWDFMPGGPEQYLRMAVPEIYQDYDWQQQQQPGEGQDTEDTRDDTWDDQPLSGPYNALGSGQERGGVINAGTEDDPDYLIAPMYDEDPQFYARPQGPGENDFMQGRWQGMPEEPLSLTIDEQGRPVWGPATTYNDPAELMPLQRRWVDEDPWGHRRDDQIQLRMPSGRGQDVGSGAEDPPDWAPDWLTSQRPGAQVVGDILGAAGGWMDEHLPGNMLGVEQRFPPSSMPNREDFDFMQEEPPVAPRGDTRGNPVGPRVLSPGDLPGWNDAINDWLIRQQHPRGDPGGEASLDQDTGWGQDVSEVASVPPLAPQDVVGTGHRWLEPVDMEGTHKGLDIQAVQGTPALSPVTGTVTNVEYDERGLGLQVSVQGEDGKVHKLSHLLKSDVKPGDQVKAGEPIAEVGSTGAGSTGPHLDYRIMSPDEQTYYNPEPSVGWMAQLPRADKPEGQGQDDDLPYFMRPDPHRPASVDDDLPAFMRPDPYRPDPMNESLPAYMQPDPYRPDPFRYEIPMFREEHERQPRDWPDLIDLTGGGQDVGVGQTIEQDNSGGWWMLPDGLDAGNDANWQYFGSQDPTPYYGGGGGEPSDMNSGTSGGSYDPYAPYTSYTPYTPSYSYDPYSDFNQTIDLGSMDYSQNPSDPYANVTDFSQYYTSPTAPAPQPQVGPYPTTNQPPTTGGTSGVVPGLMSNGGAPFVQQNAGASPRPQQNAYALAGYTSGGGGGGGGGGSTDSAYLQLQRDSLNQRYQEAQQNYNLAQQRLDFDRQTHGDSLALQQQQMAIDQDWHKAQIEYQYQDLAMRGDIQQAQLLQQAAFHGDDNTLQRDLADARNQIDIERNLISRQQLDWNHEDATARLEFDRQTQGDSLAIQQQKMALDTEYQQNRLQIDNRTIDMQEAANKSQMEIAQQRLQMDWETHQDDTAYRQQDLQLRAQMANQQMAIDNARLGLQAQATAVDAMRAANEAAYQQGQLGLGTAQLDWQRQYQSASLELSKQQTAADVWFKQVQAQAEQNRLNLDTQKAASDIWAQQQDVDIRRQQLDINRDTLTAQLDQNQKNYQLGLQKLTQDWNIHQDDQQFNRDKMALDQQFHDQDNALRLQLQQNDIASQKEIQGTFAQKAQLEMQQSALKNPWLQRLTGWAPGMGQPGGPGWNAAQIPQGQQPTGTANQPSGASPIAGATPGQSPMMGVVSGWLAPGSAPAGQNPSGWPTYQQFQAMTPFQRAAMRTVNEAQGTAWESVADQMRSNWAAQGGPTTAPNVTQLEAAKGDQLQQMNREQVAETFGTPADAYWKQQGQTWQQAATPQVQQTA